jgi:hypothetical protein
MVCHGLPLEIVWHIAIPLIFTIDLYQSNVTWILWLYNPIGSSGPIYPLSIYIYIICTYTYLFYTHIYIYINIISDSCLIL